MLRRSLGLNFDENLVLRSMILSQSIFKFLKDKIDCNYHINMFYQLKNDNDASKLYGYQHKQISSNPMYQNT